jgi:hypothetical protein
MPIADTLQENPMRKILTLVVVLGMSMLALAGCRAEGEIGENTSNITAPR